MTFVRQHSAPNGAVRSLGGAPGLYTFRPYGTRILVGASRDLLFSHNVAVAHSQALLSISYRRLRC